MKRKGLLLCCVAFLAVFVIFGGKLIAQVVMQESEADTFVELAELRSQSVTTVTTTPEASDEEMPSLEVETVSYADLLALNDDLVGWVTIPGTMIDYPVMHTPNDPEYYLHRDFYQKYSFSGTPFLDADCTVDSQHWVLYGHHMNNGTMFADLVDFRDSDFRSTHSTVYIDTLDTRYTYEVICGFYQEADGDTWTQGYFAYETAEEFAVFQAHCNASALFGSLADATFDDHLLSLVTCSGIDDNIRFVLVAQRVG